MQKIGEAMAKAAKTETPPETPPQEGGATPPPAGGTVHDV